MKRKFFIGLAGLAIMATAVVVTVSTVNANSSKLSDLLTKNLEAITQNESVGYKGYVKQSAVCPRCGGSIYACLWCVESPNSCNCEVSPHEC